MSELSDKIFNILIDANIKHEDMLDEIHSIHKEITFKLWEKFSISSVIFYMLKDTIFYNFEHLGNHEEKSGKTNMKSYGSKYPVLMYNVGNSSYVLKEHLPQLLIELNDITAKWNSDILIADLTAKNEFDWIGGEENPSSMIVYNKETENPSKYGYFANMDYLYDNFLYDSNGQKLKKEDDIVLCSIKKMDLYREYNSLTNTLNVLTNTVKSAINLNKGLLLDFENYNYEN